MAVNKKQRSVAENAQRIVAEKELVVMHPYFLEKVEAKLLARVTTSHVA